MLVTEKKIYKEKYFTMYSNMQTLKSKSPIPNKHLR